MFDFVLEPLCFETVDFEILKFLAQVEVVLTERILLFNLRFFITHDGIILSQNSMIFFFQLLEICWVVEALFVCRIVVDDWLVSGNWHWLRAL